MITELILATAMALLAGWAGYLRGQLKQVSAERERDLQRISTLGEQVRVSDERLFQQLVMMRREGFTTIPEDEPWETHVLTPEMEADIERQRLGED